MRIIFASKTYHLKLSIFVNFSDDDIPKEIYNSDLKLYIPQKSSEILI